MRLLHINSEYTSNILYKNLIIELNKNNIEQIVYATIKNSSQNGQNFIKLDKTSFKYSKPLKFYHRFLYFKKINYIFTDILYKKNLDNVDLIHAHKLFSDGGIAYKLFKKYHIPYIVAVRNTDINTFYKYMPWLKPYAFKILNNAQYIVLLSHFYKDELKRFHPKRYHLIGSRIKVIPNGIDATWLNQKDLHPKKLELNEKPFNLIFVGSFIKRKQVQLLIKQIESLINKGENVKLTLVGGGGSEHNNILTLIKDKDYISFLGSLNFNEIIEIYKNMHAFIMLSKRETFGLVYIEAISQGLPIIYSKGETIDSYFKIGEVGYPINPKDTNELLDAVNYIKNRYSHISKNCIDKAKKFDWSSVVKEYLNIYKNAVVKKK